MPEAEATRKTIVGDSGPLIALADRGEAEAIALALTNPGSTVLLDDAQARRLAERFGVDRIGTLGILRQAKKSGLWRSPRSSYSGTASVDAAISTGAVGSWAVAAVTNSASSKAVCSGACRMVVTSCRVVSTMMGRLRFGPVSPASGSVSVVCVQRRLAGVRRSFLTGRCCCGRFGLPGLNGFSLVLNSMRNGVPVSFRASR